MLDVKTLVEFVEVNREKPSPRGISCRFFKLSDQHGVKVYFDKEERNEAFQMQKQMSEHGFAPNVIVSFDAGQDYCYVTENVTVLAEQPRSSPEHDYDSYGTWLRMCDEVKKKNPNIKNEINDLCSKMSVAVPGYSNGDRHFGNFGYDKDGKLVCIDFGC